MVDAKELAQRFPALGTEHEIAEYLERIRSAPYLDLTDKGRVRFDTIGQSGKLREDDAISVSAREGTEKRTFLGGLFLRRHQWDALKAEVEKTFGEMERYHPH